MKRCSQIRLASVLAMLILTGLKSYGSERHGSGTLHIDSTTLISTSSAGPVSVNSAPIRASAKSEFESKEKKKMLAGIGYLYAGFLLVLFVCELGIRREQPRKTTLYLVKK